MDTNMHHKLDCENENAAISGVENKFHLMKQCQKSLFHP